MLFAPTSSCEARAYEAANAPVVTKPRNQQLILRLIEQEEKMTNQNFEGVGPAASREHAQQNQKMRDAASEVFAGASDTVKDAGAKAKRAAADAASTMSDHVMGFLNDQL